jgi:ABC-type multidrug transport system fused ATPase/permease subunit
LNHLFCNGQQESFQFLEAKPLNPKAMYAEIISFTLWIQMLFRPIRQLADKFNILQRGVVRAERVFEILDVSELNIVQELSIIDNSLKIIAADDKEEETEIKFLKNLRSHLKVEDVIIKQRFGSILYLSSSNSEFINFSDEIKIITKE